MVDLVPDCCVRVLSRDLHGELQLEKVCSPGS
jgi:hypothetical protein